MLRSILSVTGFLFWFLGGFRCWLWTRCIDECTNYHIWNYQHYNYYTYHQSESSENRQLLFHQGECYLSFGSMIYFKKGTHSDTLLTKCCKFTINTCLYSPVLDYAVLVNASSNDLTRVLNLCLCKDKTLLYRNTWFSFKYYLELEGV